MPEFESMAAQQPHHGTKKERFSQFLHSRKLKRDQLKENNRRRESDITAMEYSSNSPETKSNPNSIEFSNPLPELSECPLRPQRPKESAILKFPHAVVKHDFTAMESDEMSAHQCELVALLRRVDENWYHACTLDRKKIGFIPVNFLDVQIDVFIVENHYEKPSFLSQPGYSEYAQCYSMIKPDTEYTERRSPPPIPKEAQVYRRRPEDSFYKAIESYTSDVQNDLSAKENEVLIYPVEGDEFRNNFGSSWNKCMNLAGKVGLFPGNMLEAISSNVSLDAALAAAPHAVAKTEYTSSGGDFVSIKLNEAIYLGSVDGDSIFGRTASGNVGRVPSNICVIRVPLETNVKS